VSQPSILNGGAVVQITDIRAAKSRQRVNIHLDGKPAFSLEAEVAVKEGLQVGQELSDSQIETLATSDRYQRCYSAAVSSIRLRPRSKFEIRERLKRRGFDIKCIEAVINRLEETNLVDDAAFAQFWKENRESFSPRSAGLTKLELRRKGVNTDIIDQIAGDIDDTESAYQAASAKARSLPLSDYEMFRRRLSGYLKRRGFGYETIKNTVTRIWQEQGSNSR